METRSNSFLAGLFLILLGALFLIGTMGLVDVKEEVAVSLIFFTAGVVLLVAHLIFQKPLWTLIVGIAGIFIGLSIFISEARAIPDEIIGALFLVLTGTVFLTGLRGGKKNWWVIIPGGFCFIFAAHVLLDLFTWHADEYHGVLFFAGSGLVFGVLYFLKDEDYPLDWAKYPSLISFIIAGIIMMTVDFSDLFSRFIFPFVLIAIGAYVVIRSIQKEESPDKKPEEASAKKTDPEVKSAASKKSSRSVSKTRKQTK